MARYEITMTNGDQAETDTLEGLLLAARTLHADSGGTSVPSRVVFDGIPSEMLTVCARLHVSEVGS